VDRTRSLAGLAAAVVFAASLAFADDYPRQPGIDALHYIFRVTLTDASDAVSCESTAELEFVRGGVARFWLDLASPRYGKGMSVTSVVSGAAPVPYEHSGDRLIITLPAAPRAGERRSFTVAYHGVPAGGLHIVPNRYGQRTFFSWNWPTFARDWLPVIDHPSDKATSEFLVTAPAHYQVVANGALVEERDVGDGTRLTHWKESVPIASWLNNIGVAEFAARHFDTVRGVPLSTWVFPRDRENGIPTFEDPMRQAIDFFSEYIGPYPYEKPAGVQVSQMGGGMEHASEVFYGEKTVSGKPALSLVAHEVSHQWWGDSVTEKDWDDAWLSEGFATYFAALAQEHYLGQDAFVRVMSRSRAAILAMEKKTPIPVIHDNLAEIRDGRAPIGLVYQKGAWFLHMLRTLIGPDTFRDGLRAYYRRYRDSNASTADLQSVMEEVSGRKLDWFFDQWLRRGASPTIMAQWSYDAARKRLTVQLTQTQGGKPFRLPVSIAVMIPGMPDRIIPVMSEGPSVTSEVECEKQPSGVTLDPGVEVLMEARLGQK
jgi:aminopeptidase N